MQRSTEQRIALLELEQAWEKERQQYFIYRRRGYNIDPRGVEPQDRSALSWVAAGLYLAIVVVPLVMDYAAFSLVSLLLGAMVLLPGIISGISETAKAEEYAQAKKSYEQRRARILKGD